MLNRPDAANGMNDTHDSRTRRRGGTAATPTRRRSWSLTGAGRFFCAGGDLKAFAAAPTRAAFVKGVADDLHRALSTFARMDAVADHLGQRRGGGRGLQPRRDRRPGARGRVGHVHHGLHPAGLSPDGSASYYLPRLIGIRRRKQLMLTNRTLSAAGGLDWGLVTEVVPDDRARRTHRGAGRRRWRATSRDLNGGGQALLLGTFPAAWKSRWNSRAA